MKMAKEIQKENLRAAAHKKKELALEKTELAIKQLLKRGSKINVSAVAKEANVSISYLYKYPEIKQRIQQLRDEQSRLPRKDTYRATDASNKVIIIQLRERVKKLETETRELREINESLAGRVHQLMGYQTQVQQLQIQNLELQKRLEEYRQQQPISLPPSNSKVTSISNAKKSEPTDKIKSELNSLGIKLTSTLSRAIKASTEETVLNAIEALKEALEKDDIKSPGGWLKSAIEGGWIKNEILKQHEESSLPAGFEQWYRKAIEVGFVLDLPVNFLNLDRHHQPLVKVDRPSTFAPYTQMPWEDAKAEMETML